jgi:hypothetical protein
MHAQISLFFVLWQRSTVEATDGYDLYNVMWLSADTWGNDANGIATGRRSSQFFLH